MNKKIVDSALYVKLFYLALCGSFFAIASLNACDVEKNIARKTVVFNEVKYIREITLDGLIVDYEESLNAFSRKQIINMVCAGTLSLTTISFGALALHACLGTEAQDESAVGVAAGITSVGAGIGCGARYVLRPLIDRFRQLRTRE